VIGDAKTTSLPPLATFIPTGVEMLNLMKGIIAARSLFDSSSSLVAKDLEGMKLRLEKANRCNVTVLASWTALKSSFQTYSQAVSSWARSPQALSEPSLMAKSPHTDFLWAKAHQGALLTDGIDPAWTGLSATTFGKGPHSMLSALSVSERKTLMFNLQRLERPASPKPTGGGATPGYTAAASAPGDGKVKTRGTAL
jgi:hypothetical protein